jgi:hypothetical protein
MKGGETHAPNIRPGEPYASPLVTFISSTDADERVPPNVESLTPAEVALVRQWIREGAHWPDSASLKLVAPSEWCLQGNWKRGFDALHPLHFLSDSESRDFETA